MPLLFFGGGRGRGQRPSGSQSQPRKGHRFCRKMERTMAGTGFTPVPRCRRRNGTAKIRTVKGSRVEICGANTTRPLTARIGAVVNGYRKAAHRISVSRLAVGGIFCLSFVFVVYLFLRFERTSFSGARFCFAKHLLNRSLLGLLIAKALDCFFDIFAISLNVFDPLQITVVHKLELAPSSQFR